MPDPKPTRSYSPSVSGSTDSGSTTSASSTAAIRSAMRRVLPCDFETQTMSAFIAQLLSRTWPGRVHAAWAPRRRVRAQWHEGPGRKSLLVRSVERVDYLAGHVLDLPARVVIER